MQPSTLPLPSPTEWEPAGSDVTRREKSARPARPRWILSASSPGRWPGARRERGPLGTVLAVLPLAILFLASCRVVQPTVEDGLDYGFQTPKQAFRAWRTAVAADLLAEEYACFSRDWRADNGVTSITAYGAVRDELLKEVPRLRWAISRAEDPEEIAANGMRAVLLRSKIPGALWFGDRYLTVKMIREASFEVYDEAVPDQPVASGPIEPDPWTAETFVYRPRTVVSWLPRTDVLLLVIAGFDDLTRGINPGAVTEMWGGWRWKIAEIVVSEEPLEWPER